jgi:pimeloyl-ACP methyl ester carboxylesterase
MSSSAATSTLVARPSTLAVGDVTVAFLEAGDPRGQHTVLLHGGSSSAATWHRLTTALVTAGHHVIAADLRGHGASSRSRDYPLAGYADDIAGLLEALAIPSATLVGHSLGGYVAAVLAQRDPARVTRLVLEEPGLPAFHDGERHLSGVRFLLPGLLALASRRGSSVRAVTAAVRQLRAPDAAFYDGLASIGAPTLVVSGGPASHQPPQRLAGLARAIPHGQLVTIPVGHRVHSQAPEQFLAAVMPFLTAGTDR